MTVRDSSAVRLVVYQCGSVHMCVSRYYVIVLHAHRKHMHQYSLACVTKNTRITEVKMHGKLMVQI